MSYIIGIDPDSDKSGFAVWDYENQKFTEIKSVSFFDLIDFLNMAKFMIKLVRIEAGWLNKKTNWHYSGNKKIGEKIAAGIGKNQMIGKLIGEYCKRMTVPFEFVKPLGTKFMTAELFKEKTGWQEHTNQDGRDAAMLVYSFGSGAVKN